MPDLLRSPWSSQFDALIGSASKSLVLCAPLVGRGPCERVKRRIEALALEGFGLTLLTDFSTENILCGATDVAAIADLVSAWPSAIIRFLPSLHAKIYNADESCAVVTSGNLTDSSLLRNSSMAFDSRSEVQFNRSSATYSTMRPLDRPLTFLN